MAKELIATLITNSNGEAFYTYTGTGAGETTFIAESGDLESEPLIINDVLERITLTTDKNILSYADNDTVTLTATYDGTTLEGKSVVFKLGDRVLDTVTTDSEGVAEYEYSSQGMGDIVFTAECGELQETISIEDCTYYKANPTTCTNCNISLPSSAIVSYKMSKPNVGSGGGVDIQFKDNSHTYFIGNWASYGDNGLLIRNTGSSSNLIDQRCSGISANTEYLLGVSYNNGEWTVFKDDEVQSVTANYTPTTLNVINIQQGYMKDLKIKPLPFNGTMTVTSNKDVLSYADNDSCTLIATLTGDDVANKPVVFKNGNTVLDTVNTNSNGVATYTYSSQGIGDVTITAECMNLQETYEVHDYWKYIENGSKTFSSSSMDWQVLSDLNGISDFELTYEISATGNQGFAIGMSSNNTDTSNTNNKVRGQVDGASYYGTYTDINGSQTYTTYSSQYSANTYFTVTLQCVDGHITITHNGKTHTDNRTFNLRYLMIGNWKSAKTINYKNLIVKPL